MITVDTLNWIGGVITAIALGAAGCGLLLLTRDHRETRGFQLRLFLAAFAMRLVVAVLIYAGGLLSVVKDEDSIGWFESVALSDSWHAKGLAAIAVPDVAQAFVDTANKGYLYLLAGFFWITGLVGRLPAAALNAWFGALAVVLVYRLTRRLATDRAARWTAFVVAGMPLMVIWSAQTLKEPVVFFIEAVGLYACLRVHEGSLEARHLLVALLAFVLIIPVRFYVGFVLGATFIGALGWSAWRSKGRSGAWLLRIGASIAVVIPLVALGRNVVAKQYDLQYAQAFREIVSSGEPPKRGGTFARAEAARVAAASPTPAAAPPASTATFDIRKPAHVPLLLVTGFAYTLLAPFPWQFFGGSSVRLVLTLPDVLLWWTLLFAIVIPGIWRCLKSQAARVVPLVVFLVLLGGLYSAMFGNAGIAYRQRAQLVPVLLALAAAGRAPRIAAPRRSGD